MTSWILFDLGGVVFRPQPRERLRLLARSSPLSELDVEGALWGSGLVEDAERGLYDARQFAGEAARRARLTLDYAELKDAWASGFEPQTAVLDLIERLRPGLAVGTFANGSELAQFGLERNWASVMGRFACSIWSYQARALKPAPEAFAFALRRLGLPAAEVCYVGRHAATVAAARDAGWDAVEFTDPVALGQELRRRGLLAGE